MELLPNEGIGDIRFSMTPPKVRAIMGNTLVYEDWMGGNINDTLHYSGIVLSFDKHDAYGPLDDAKLIEMWIYNNFNATFNGITLFGQSITFIETLLQQEGIGYEMRGNKNKVGIFIDTYGWQFAFKESWLFTISLYSKQ